MKRFALVAVLVACAADPDTRSVASNVCTVQDQQNGCDANSWRKTYTKNWGQSQLGATAIPLDAGCQVDSLGLQCYVSFELFGESYTVICGFGDEGDGIPSCEVE